MKPVVFNPVAVSDLAEIVSYIAQDNPDAANRVRHAILSTAELLGRFPALGGRPSFSATRFAGIRFLPAKRFRNYLLFYREDDDALEVLRVLHAARDAQRLFQD